MSKYLGVTRGGGHLHQGGGVGAIKYGREVGGAWHRCATRVDARGCA